MSSPRGREGKSQRREFGLPQVASPSYGAHYQGSDADLSGVTRLSWGDDQSLRVELPSGGVKSWNTAACCQWLSHIGMDQYETAFNSLQVCYHTYKTRLMSHRMYCRLTGQCF